MKTILVGLDGSPSSVEVLAQAASLARATGAKLVLLRVVGLPVELPREALTHSPEDLPGILQGIARQRLNEMAETVPKELIQKIRVDIGSPWQGILNAGRDENADLIIIGSHGHGLIDRVLGTTASRVVNHADRAVLVARPRA